MSGKVKISVEPMYRVELPDGSSIQMLPMQREDVIQSYSAEDFARLGVEIEENDGLLLLHQTLETMAEFQIEVEVYEVNSVAPKALRDISPRVIGE